MRTKLGLGGLGLLFVLGLFADPEPAPQTSAPPKTITAQPDHTPSPVTPQPKPTANNTVVWDLPSPTKAVSPPTPQIYQAPPTPIKQPLTALERRPVTTPRPPWTRVPAQTKYVDANRLNVRQEPDKRERVVWTLKRDQAVTVVAKQGEWLAVKGQRFQGWVFGTYLTNKPAPKRLVAPVQTSLSIAKVKQLLIKRSHAYYSGNCPCPYNRTASGRRCGKRSAYSRPGGAEPLCYARDVTNAMVKDYLARN